MNLSANTTPAAASSATPARLTFAKVRAALADIGVSIAPNDWNEYRVNARGNDPEEAALIDRGHTREDQQHALEEALMEGRAMAERERVSPVAAAVVAAKAKGAPVTYRLGSSGFVHAPGIVAYAVNGYVFKSDRAKMVKLIADCWSIPLDASAALLSKASPYHLDGETVVFTY